MAPVGPERERPYPSHRVDAERTIEMGEQVASARGLPAEAITKITRSDGDEHEIALAIEVAAQGLGELGARREVDEAVPEVDRRAAVGARCDGIVPLGGGQTL